jgi:hypothetical protein
MGILERYAEGCAMIGKFDGESVGVWCIDEGIPPHGGITLGVRQRRRVFIGFDEDLRSVAANDGEKRVSIGLLESRLKAKPVAVKSDGLINVADNEERRNRLRRCSCHKRALLCRHNLSSSSYIRQLLRAISYSLFTVFQLRVVAPTASNFSNALMDSLVPPKPFGQWRYIS